MAKMNFEELFEEGWNAEILGGYHTDHGYPFWVTKWSHEEENIVVYAVISGEEENFGVYDMYEDAEARSKYLARFYSSDDSGCYCSE